MYVELADTLSRECHYVKWLVLRQYGLCDLSIVLTLPLILALVGVTLGSNASQLHLLDVDGLKLVAVAVRVLIQVSR